MGHKIIEGWIPTPGHEEEDVFKSLVESQGFFEFGDIEGIRDTGKGKLSLTYKAALTLSGEELFAKEAQTGPDCTSHASRNAWDIARANDIMLGEPEEWVARGATELIYGMRGHRGGGMNVGRAVRFLNEYGNLVRQPYGPVDLSRYDFDIGDDWGGSGTPSLVKELAAEFPAAYFFRIRNVEQARDALASGYGVVCGSRFGSSRGVRDKNGYLRWDGTWNHAMAWVGCDARDGKCDPVVAQSWGDYGRGGHPDWGQLPKGCFLIREEDAQRMIDTGECYMLGRVKGIPARDLPDYGASTFL